MKRDEQKIVNELRSHKSDVNINDIWSAIESDVDTINVENKRKRRGYFWVFFACGMLLMVSLVGYQLFTNDQDELVQAENVEKTSKQQNKIVNQDSKEIKTNNQSLDLTKNNLKNSIDEERLREPSKVANQEYLKEESLLDDSDQQGFRISNDRTVKDGNRDHDGNKSIHKNTSKSSIISNLNQPEVTTYAHKLNDENETSGNIVKDRQIENTAELVQSSLAVDLLETDLSEDEKSNSPKEIIVDKSELVVDEVKKENTLSVNGEPIEDLQVSANNQKASGNNYSDDNNKLAQSTLIEDSQVSTNDQKALEHSLSDKDDELAQSTKNDEQLEDPQVSMNDRKITEKNLAGKIEETVSSTPNDESVRTPQLSVDGQKSLGNDLADQVEEGGKSTPNNEMDHKEKAQDGTGLGVKPQGPNNFGNAPSTNAINWAVGIYGGIAATSQTLKDRELDTLSASLLNLRINTERTLETVQFGINGTAKLFDKLEITTGIQYSRMTELFTYISSDSGVPTDSIYDIAYYFKDLDDNLVPIYGQVPQTETIVTDKKIYNYYHMIDIPFLVGYQHNFGKFSAGFQTGIMANVQLKTKGQILDGDHDFLDIKENQSDVFQSSLGIGYQVAIPLRYQLTDHLDISLTPYWRKLGQSLTLDTYTIEEKYSFLGGNLGLRWRL